MNGLQITSSRPSKSERITDTCSSSIYISQKAWRIRNGRPYAAFVTAIYHCPYAKRKQQNGQRIIPEHGKRRYIRYAEFFAHGTPARIDQTVYWRQDKTTENHGKSR